MSEIPIGAWLEAMDRGASYPGRPIPPLRLNDPHAGLVADIQFCAAQDADPLRLNDDALTPNDADLLGRVFAKFMEDEK